MVSINSNNIPDTENTFPKLLIKHANDRAPHPAFRQIGLKWDTGQFTSVGLDLSLPNLVL